MKLGEDLNIPYQLRNIQTPQHAFVNMRASVHGCRGLPSRYDHSNQQPAVQIFSSTILPSALTDLSSLFVLEAVNPKLKAPTSNWVRLQAPPRTRHLTVLLWLQFPLQQCGLKFESQSPPLPMLWDANVGCHPARCWALGRRAQGHKAKKAEQKALH